MRNLYQLKSLSDALGSRNKLLNALDSLKTIYDLSAYLADKENQEATHEIEKIPNIGQKLQEAELDVIEGNLVDWNDLKNGL